MGIRALALCFIVLLLNNEVAESAQVLQERTEGFAQSFLSSAAGSKIFSATITSPCIFGSFNGSLALSTLNVENEVAFSEQACQTVLQSRNRAAVGYVYRPYSCQIISGLPVDYSVDSGVCIQRGGCSGTGDPSSCAWLDLPSSSLLPILNLLGSRIPTTLIACKSLCELNSSCIAFSFNVEVGACSLFSTTVSEFQTSMTGFCLPVMQFVTPPGRCDKNATCGKQPVISVPSVYGDAKVVLSKKSGTGDFLQNVRSRSSNGTAVFSDVGFSDGGSYIIEAISQDVPCPVVSKAITVTDRDLQTLWRWIDLDFPGNEFWLMRVEHDCPKIAIIIAAIGVVGTGFVLSTSLQKFLVFVIPYIVFFRDLIWGWNFWKCSAEYGNRLKVNGVSINPK